MTRCFDLGCAGCDECTDYDDDDADEPRERQDFGCCFPGECCMPGLHFPSECHTAAMYEAAHPLAADPQPVPGIEDMKP